MDLNASNMATPGTDSMVRSGKLSVSIHFDKPTSCALQLICMASAPNVIEIDDKLILTESH